LQLVAWYLATDSPIPAPKSEDEWKTYNENWQRFLASKGWKA
jgi:hypothetical protein